MKIRYCINTTVDSGRKSYVRVVCVCVCVVLAPSCGWQSNQRLHPKICQGISLSAVTGFMSDVTRLLKH